MKTLRILDLEQYIPVMSETDRDKYFLCVVGAKPDDFTDDQVAAWSLLLSARNNEMKGRIDDAISKSNPHE
ncbi:MAG: hypothetical protein NTZ69_15780 [Bacteroidia bacterium]|nr:hypothetical protein [Bacteroidia bacterium]